MRTRWIAGLMMLGGVSAPAADCERRKTEVTVFLRGGQIVPAVELVNAQKLAVEMFAKIGVVLHWRSARTAENEGACPQDIFVDMGIEHMVLNHPGALAYAKPFGDKVIQVIWDVVRETSANETSGHLLAHVMVHEIAHVLEGVKRHSSSGVMKATWSLHDYRLMAAGPLPFAEDDVQLIQLGIARMTASVK